VSPLLLQLPQPEADTRVEPEAPTTPPTEESRANVFLLGGLALAVLVGGYFLLKKD